MKRRLSGLLVITTTIAAASVGFPARAQTVIENDESIDFDRPEAWAQKYFTSVAMLSGLGVPRRVEPWSLRVGLEIGSVPTLSDKQLTVGFNGTKREDLNKTDLFGRLDVTVGLPRRWSLTVAYTPPLEVDGATPHLLGLALARPVLEAGPARFGLRLHGQFGTVEGDFTCSESVVAAGDDPVVNPFGCQQPSDDEFRSRYAGLEASVAFPLRDGRIEPFLSGSANYLDTEFRVNARYSGIVDRTRLETDGWTWYVTGGSEFAVSERWAVAVELFYSPLDILRPGFLTAETDGLFNVRAAARWTLR